MPFLKRNQSKPSPMIGAVVFEEKICNLEPVPENPGVFWDREAKEMYVLNRNSFGRFKLDKLNSKREEEFQEAPETKRSFRQKLGDLFRN